MKTKRRTIFINPAQLGVVIAQGNYVRLHYDTRAYLLRETISLVAKELQPYGFVRIHRSVLINRAFVEELKPELTGEYTLRVKGGKEYTVSRTYKQNLRLLADTWIGNGTGVTDPVACESISGSSQASVQPVSSSSNYVAPALLQPSHDVEESISDRNMRTIP